MGSLVRYNHNQLVMDHRSLIIDPTAILLIPGGACFFPFGILVRVCVALAYLPFFHYSLYYKRIREIYEFATEVGDDDDDQA
jgi:hypothetical protein